MKKVIWTDEDRWRLHALHYRAYKFYRLWGRGRLASFLLALPDVLFMRRIL